MALQTAAHDGPVLFLALELSKSAWLLAAHLPGANKPKLHRIEAGDTAALLATITALRARVAGEFGTGRSTWPAASRRPVTAPGSTGCRRPTASPATCWSGPASWSTAAPDGPR